jgi:hypothetical protein
MKGIAKGPVASAAEPKSVPRRERVRDMAPGMVPWGVIIVIRFLLWGAA